MLHGGKVKMKGRLPSIEATREGHPVPDLATWDRNVRDEQAER